MHQQRTDIILRYTITTKNKLIKIVRVIVKAIQIKSTHSKKS